VSYNTFGELAGESSTFGTTSLLSETYASSTNPRDALGRIVNKIEVVQGSSVQSQYTYDAGGRLTDVVSTAGSSHYTYDANGNRLTTSTPSITASATYDSQDRLLTHGIYSYTYTANGELSKKTNTVDGTSTTYTYDAFGSLKRVDLPNADVIEYVTDGLQRRIAKKKNGTYVKRWLYRDQLHPLAELDGNGALLSRFAYATGKNSPDYMINGGINYRILSDHLGSPRLVVNASSGAVVQRLRHDEFGNVLEDTNPGFTPFGFGGGLYDADTGLVLFGARDYDPSVGRWMSKDPVLFNGGQANLYVYVDNDPMNAADPAGTGPLEIAKCLLDGYSLSECLGDEQKLLCKNWGIACDGDTPLPPGRPAFPPGPSDPGPGMCDRSDERDCEEQFEIDTATCDGIFRRRGAAAARRCTKSAAERYGNCLAGRPIGPLDTWNN
jgi:RHS repeat-associated protein